jgi:hypothetical protein
MEMHIKRHDYLIGAPKVADTSHHFTGTLLHFTGTLLPFRRNSAAVRRNSTAVLPELRCRLASKEMKRRSRLASKVTSSIQEHHKDHLPDISSLS